MAINNLYCKFVSRDLYCRIVVAVDETMSRQKALTFSFCDIISRSRDGLECFKGKANEFYELKLFIYLSCYQRFN